MRDIHSANNLRPGTPGLSPILYLRVCGGGVFDLDNCTVAASCACMCQNGILQLEKCLTVRPCKPLKVMYVRGGQTCFGAFWGKKSYRDVR
jgi:hypothetical protein